MVAMQALATQHYATTMQLALQNRSMIPPYNSDIKGLHTLRRDV